MLRFSTINRSAFRALLIATYFLVAGAFAHAQTLSIKDFAVWGGSSSATDFDKKQGVFIKSNTTIKGNVGTNHLVDVHLNFALTGNIYSGNGVDLKLFSRIKGDIVALKLASNFKGNVISAMPLSKFDGNLIANGKIDIKSARGALANKILGSVSVPAPSKANYSGPAPAGGISNTLVLPTLPGMPGITQLGNPKGKTKINGSRSISPGVYDRIELKGKNTLTFNGPGNYIFKNVNNKGENNLIFDLKNSSGGTINIYILEKADWGAISVKLINGTSPSQIFTEVQGENKKGAVFEVASCKKIPSGSSLWLGNVWAPNGGIKIGGSIFSPIANIKGALWSGVYVALEGNLTLEYEAPSNATLTFVEPYYPPPANGKVTPQNDIIGAELNSLATNPTPIIFIPDNEIFVIDNVAQKVMIEVISKVPNDNTLLNQLVALGMTDIIDNGPHEYIITGNFPISRLTQLNSNIRIEYVRPLYPPLNNRGQVTTQGDVTMRTDKVRERFGLDGSGVKVGVISDSYNNKSGAQNDVDQGDLPGIKTNGEIDGFDDPVQVKLDLSSGGSDEGRAMLQIVHDVAPKAKLAFRTGFLSAGDFAKGIKELASPDLEGGKCDVIVDDLTYITEPFLRDGVVAKTLDEVVADGITYFTSAGNFGKKSYEGVFNGVTNTSIAPAPAQVHQFGGSPQDIFQTINLKPGTYTIVLQWDDEFHSLGDEGVQTDLDLYILGPTGFTLFGFNRSNLFKDPFEVCPFTVKEETTARIAVVRANGNSNVRFKYIIFRGDATILDYQTGNSTIVGHANSNGAISVGAMLYANIPGITPVWPGVASFSSRGGTFTREGGSFTTRNKPDLVGPNGVNTTVDLGGAFFDDGDIYPNFFGTSAAAPHAAAVGALLIQARKKFNQQTVITPSEIRAQMINTAGQFPNLPPTFNFEGGNGFILADEAVLEIANAKPKIDTIFSVTPGGETGSDPFMVKVVGEYLTENTQIYVSGSPVATSVSQDRREATAMVNALNGTDPPFQLFNPAKSPSGEDGGLSEPIYFFDSNPNEVIVKAINKTRKYGQPNPEFEVEISVGGVPINLTDITPADLKLGEGQITISTIATPESRVGTYGIFVRRTTPLDDEDSLLSKYTFTFIPGSLLIEKIPLKITPKNTLITYGKFPEDIDYDYELPAELAGNETLLDEIKLLHRQFIPENGLVVLNNIAQEGHGVEFADFENMGVLASYQSLMSARKVAYENGILKPLTGELPVEQIGDQRFIVDVDANSMAQFKIDSSETALLPSYRGTMPRGLLGLKALVRGEAEASVPNGRLRAMVNGRLQAMVNGDLQAIVNGRLRALVNGEFVDAEDITFLNGQLRALVNGIWVNILNGRLRALVNNEMAEFELSVVNGRLQAVVNGELMPLVNGQLRAVVNGQLVAMVNGKLRALVNGRLVPLVNGRLVAVVNGQLRPLVNGQLVAVVNGQLMAVVNGELELIDELSFVNGTLRALVNNEIEVLSNGRLKAMVNGVVTDVPVETLNLVNGQLRALVNGQLVAMVNGQLRAVVNGQLRPLVNGDAVEIQSVEQLANGRLRAVVNGQSIPIVNGQLRAMVNGQLLAMVNGQLMAVVNGELTFVVFQNGQLRALVNGELIAEPLANGQLKAVVNGQLSDVSNYEVLANGELRAIVNSEEWIYPNGQLKPLVNGRLQPLVNNFDVSGSNNNVRTMVVVDENDIELQGGDLGSMFALPMITGNTAINGGQQKIVPAAFINENYEVTYGLGDIEVLQAPLIVKATDTSKVYGTENPVFTRTYNGIAFDDSEFVDFVPPVAQSSAVTFSPVATYPIDLVNDNALGNNYFLLNEPGELGITKAPLLVKADDKSRIEGVANPVFTISYTGLLGTDEASTICTSSSNPNIVQPGTVYTSLERQYTYSDIKINNQTSIYDATPGEALTLTGSWNQVFVNPENAFCPGCISQMYIGMGDGNGGNTFTDCYDVTGLQDNSGTINKSFTAPTEPGIYYITKRSSWYFSCYQADQPAIIHDDPIYVIAVVVVREPVVIVPPGNTYSSLERQYTFNNISINNQSSTYTAQPGESLTLTGSWNQVFENPENPLCPGCISQMYIGMGDANGGNTFTTCYDVTGLQNNSGVINETFNAPTTPGVYYITKRSSWYFSCYQADQPPILHGDSIFVIGVVIVDGVLGNVPDKLFATSTATFVSPVGSYPIILQGCTSFNPNYEVTLRIGTLTITPDEVPIVVFSSANTNGRDDVVISAVPAIKSPLNIPENTIYPNPAQHAIRVYLSEDVKHPGDIQVIDNVGRTASTTTTKIDARLYETNVSRLVKGVYFLKVQTETGIKTIKFVKL